MHDNATVRNTRPAEKQTETTNVQAEVCNFSNLLSAESRCHRGVGYKNSVARFHMLKLSKLYELHCELMNGTYHTQKGQDFEIFEPKKRIVTSTKYKDRVIQASFIVNYMYDNVISKLINNNFACIKGKGVDRARETFKDILRKSSMDDYCLCADLKDYFGSIEHDIIVRELQLFLKDKWVAEYYKDVINSNGKEKGIGLGSEINQLSAVAFLHKLDVLLDSGQYERYMDDFRYVGPKEECQRALELIKFECERLHIQLSDKKTYIQLVKNPIKFLGFTFLKHQNGRITMKRMKSKLNNEKRKLRKMKKSKVAFEDVQIHYECVRATMKKGSRSGVVKLDKYFNDLFKEELTNVNQKE